MIDPTIRHALTKRCCPICVAPLLLGTDGGGKSVIQCSGSDEHQFALADIWDCPTQQRIDILQREGQMIVRGLRQGQDTGRRPADDMADLYNL